MSKRTMVLGMAAMAVAMVAQVAEAQAPASGSITATATIPGYIQVGATQNLNLGSAIVPGAAVSVAANSADAGFIALRFNVDTDVELTVPSSLVSGANSLPVTITCASRLASAAVADASGIACGSVHTYSASTLTERVFHFGGSITGAATGAAVPGTYNATITLDARLAGT